jgi:hypothetical protein
MRRSAAFLFLILLAVGALTARAQVAASATTRQFSLTVGGMVSAFQPDFAGYWQPPSFQYPMPQAGPQPLFGVGAYVDVKLTRWVQLEGEARWLRYNQYYNIHQDNYLVGPRVPIARVWKATAYAKALGGYSKMNFDSGAGDSGRFTTVAFGGGLDVKLTRRISLRAVDVEYQYWPMWGNTSLSPYGASMGIGYRIF